MDINSLYNINCYDGLKNIEDKSINLILFDPPHGSFKKLKWDTMLDLEIINKEFERILVDNGIVLFFASGRYIFEAYNLNPKQFKYELIWKKSKSGSPLTAKYMPLRLHEFVLVFGTSKSTYNVQFTDGKPYKRKKTELKNNNMNFGIKTLGYESDGKRFPNSILDFPQNWRPQDQIHPTQKPVELYDFLIKTYSNENELILDCCLGSGNSIISCIKNKRNYIGMELDEEVFAKANNNILTFINN